MEAKYVDYSRNLLAGLCEYPDDVKIKAERDDRGILITATVNKADMGGIIGREGKTIKAIRWLIGVAGKMEDALVSLVLTEPDGSIREPRKEE